jgi:hypothetical protein
VAVAIELGNAYTGQPPPHEIGHLCCARPTPLGGTPSISLIPPGACGPAKTATFRLRSWIGWAGYESRMSGSADPESGAIPRRPIGRRLSPGDVLRPRGDRTSDADVTCYSFRLAPHRFAAFPELEARARATGLLGQHQSITHVRVFKQKPKHKEPKRRSK